MGGGGDDEKKKKKGTWHGNNMLLRTATSVTEFKEYKTFQKETKLFLSQQTYSAEKYLCYEVLTQQCQCV